MADGFLSEIRIMSFSFAPQGWASCNGQLLPINQNQALFSLLGTTYGGNGQTNFALPDMRGRTAFHTNFNAFTLGQRGGEESHTLTTSELPTHIHSLPTTGPTQNNCNTTANSANVANAVGNFWADAGKLIYTTEVANASMSAQSVSSVGGSQPHENRSPFLTLNFCILLQGIFPSQN
jgi:microcystin-dependent protein